MHVAAFDLVDGRLLWERDDPAPTLSASWFHAAGGELVQLRAQGHVSTPRDVHTFLTIDPRSGRIRGQTSSLDDLAVFDEGPIVVDGWLYLLDRDEPAGAAPRHELVRHPLQGGDPERFAIEGLPEATVKKRFAYSVFAAAGGALAGTIDVRRGQIGMPQQTIVFTFDGKHGLRTLDVDRPGGEEAGLSAVSTIATRDALLVLREGRLYVFPTGGP
jgi:hypothetical protein